MGDKNLRTALILVSVAAVFVAGYIARFYLFGR
ncbi:cytochrome oxidase small assembly protein [Chitinimonas sp.]